MTLDAATTAERRAVLNAIATFGGGTLATIDALAKSTRLENEIVQRYVYRLLGEGLIRARVAGPLGPFGSSVIAYRLTADGRAEVMGDA